MSRVLIVDDRQIVGHDRDLAQTGICKAAEPGELPWPIRRWSDEAGRSRNRSRDSSAITGGLPCWAAGLRLAVLMLALVSPGAVAQTAVETPRTIRVVIDNDYAPYSFQSDEGKLQGILIDQWQAWEKKTGIKVELHAMDWGDAVRRMRAGEFDVIDSIVETAERRDYFDFTPAYATIETPIFFRHDISGITDLIPKRISDRGQGGGPTY